MLASATAVRDLSQRYPIAKNTSRGTDSRMDDKPANPAANRGIDCKWTTRRVGELPVDNREQEYQIRL